MNWKPTFHAPILSWGRALIPVLMLLPAAFGTDGVDSTVRPMPAEPKVGDEGQKFWAFQPVRKLEPPQVKNKEWPRNAIDQFILRKLEEKHVSPSDEANKPTLLRRLTLDLVGLPPSRQEIQ